MKKYILGLTIAASTLSLVGCSDFLDTPVLGQQDLSEYFVNEDQCKQQITGCYQSIFWDDWWQVQKFYLCGDEVSDVKDGIGLVSSRVMLCAAHQAHIVLRILAEEYEV